MPSNGCHLGSIVPYRYCGRAPAFIIGKPLWMLHTHASCDHQQARLALETGYVVSELSPIIPDTKAALRR